MFKNNLSEIFPFVYSLYDISELILVGSDITGWLDIVSGHDLEKVHYINQSDKNYNFDSLPQNWQVSSKMLAKEDGDTTFYTLSNPMLNGTVSSDVLVNLWQNLKTLESTQKEAVSLKTFIEKECNVNGSKMVVVDSFDGLSLVNELDSLQVDVVALRVVADDDEMFTNASETKVKQRLQEFGYKNIATYEDNHPKIKTAVYVKDVKRQTREYEENLNSVKQNTQKEFSEIKTQLKNKTKELAKLKSELETKNKALQEKQANSEQLQKQKTELENKTKEYENNLNAVNEEVTAFKNKTKTLEENLQQITNAKDASQKELSEIKTQLENKTKELVTANQTKEQELVKLKSELETKNKALQEKQANSEQLQKQKTELENKTKEYENNLNAVNEEVTAFKNKTKTLEENLQQITNAKDASQKELSEIKTQLENKTKELATANQTKEQELVKLKSELETKNKALQEKQANSEQLQKQKTELEKKTKTLEENLIKEKTANENLQKELSSSKAELELKTQEFTKNLKRELKESEYILKQATKLVGIEDFSIVSLAEISQNAKDYRKAIQYWQQLASKLENKMPQIFYRRLLQAYEKIGGFPKGSEEEEQLKGSLDKHEVLGELHKILHPNLYLEIGVQTGKSLKLAECRAIGIDPMPMIKFELGINHELIEESSDNFFKTKAATILTEPIDFSFIDGMHLFEYALRDFINVEKYSTKDTIVVMDDVYPGHEAQASRDRKTRAWTGDVWKVVSILKKYRPDLKITLLDVYPTGLMIIENLNNKNNILSQNYKKIVKKYMNKKINNEKYIRRADSIKLEELEELWKFKK